MFQLSGVHCKVGPIGFIESGEPRPLVGDPAADVVQPIPQEDAGICGS